MPIDIQRLRFWWWQRQGLGGALTGRTEATILGRAGWARSVGGAGPYLSLFARGGIGREAVDSALARLEIQELPAARGCTYIVPAADYALALSVGQRFAGAEMAVALKLGVTAAEIDTLCDRVLAALAGGPLDTEAIRMATGDAARSLGEAGKKKGISTTLPLALGRLQAEGELRRLPVKGRIDQQRYLYARWGDNPLAGSTLTPDEAGQALAERFFRWIGPARLGEFQWFSGFGAKACRALADALGLVPAAADSDFLLLPGDLDAFNRIEIPTRPAYTLIANLDSLVAARRDVSALIDPEDAGHSLIAAGGKPGGIRDELPSHAILDRGRLIGLWEYDPAARQIVWASLAPPDDALQAVIGTTETYVNEQLGDVRAFSLDSPKSRAPRLDTLRGAARFR